MTSTLLLDEVSWDLLLDTSGNIAVATNPYALAQDAASAIRLFLGELYFDASVGVPYREKILGRSPPISLLKSLLVSAALSVSGVKSAVCYITSVSGRTVRGQVQVTDVSGTQSAAAF